MYDPPMDSDMTLDANNGVGCSERNTVTRVTHGNTVTRSPDELDGCVGAAYVSDKDLMKLWREAQRLKCEFNTFFMLVEQRITGTGILSSEQLSDILQKNLDALLTLSVNIGILEILYVT